MVLLTIAGKSKAWLGVWSAVPMHEGCGWLCVLKEGRRGVCIIQQSVLTEGEHSKVSAIYEHDSTASLRVHSDIRTSVVVQQPSLAKKQQAVYK